MTALQKLKPAPLLLATVAGLPWWLLVLVVVLTLYFYGAEPAVRWLDVVDRIRGVNRGSRTVTLRAEPAQVASGEPASHQRSNGGRSGVREASE